MAIAPDAAKIGPYTAPSADDAHDDAARDASNKKAILQQIVKRTTLAKDVDRQESLESVPARDRKRMADALDGAFGPEARAWAGNPHIQRNLTTLQRREQLLSMADNAPGARPAAQSMQSLSQDPSFAKLMPAGRSSQLMGEVHQSLATNPKLEGSIRQALQSAFVSSDKGLPQTKQDFARFALKMGGQNNLVSIKKAGDMLGTLAGQQISTRAQSDALRMAERDPSNLRGMDAVEGFVRQEDVMALPRPAASAAVSLLSRANGTEEARQGLTDIARDNTFSNLSDENKAGLFEAMNRSKTADVVALKQKSLQILSLPNVAGVDGRITRMLDKYGQQIATGGAKGVHPGTLARASRARVLPGPPALIDTHDIEDPDDRARAGRQNRAKLKEYANDVDRAYREMDRGLDRANSFDDVNGLTGLQEPECYDRPRLDDAPIKNDIDKTLSALQQRGGEGEKVTSAARAEMMDDVATASVLSRDEQQKLAGLIEKALTGKLSISAYREAKTALLQPVIEQRFAVPPNEKARAYATIAVKNAKLAGALNISEQEQRRVDEILAPLSEGANSRRMSPAEFDSALKEVEQAHLRSATLSPSEVTYLSARVQSVRLRRQYSEVSIKKNKVLKEMRRKPLTAEQRRKKAAARRAVGVQARYVAVDAQKANALGASALPTAASATPAPTPSNATRSPQARDVLARGSSERQQLVADVATQVIEQLVTQGLLGGQKMPDNQSPRSSAPIKAVTREQPRGQAVALVNQIMDRLAQAGAKDAIGVAPELPNAQGPDMAEREGQAAPPSARSSSWTQGLVDKNNIPRTFPRELGGMQSIAPVRPPKPKKVDEKKNTTPSSDDDKEQGR